MNGNGDAKIDTKREHSGEFGWVFLQLREAQRLGIGDNVYKLDMLANDFVFLIFISVPLCLCVSY